MEYSGSLIESSDTGLTIRHWSEMATDEGVREDILASDGAATLI